MTKDISIQEFQDKVWAYYQEHKRPMPWREKHDFYSVLVSELMLQQTQVSRVLPKFAEFMGRFPTINQLAQASLAEVLIAWQGLGYNRRAKFLHSAAQAVVEGGELRTIDALQLLPGIGPNTAAAMMAYIYNEPVVFVETNIRTVFLDEFFPEREAVTDAEIREILAQTIDQANPREWYWALMDYGTYLKSLGKGAIARSAHYKKQTPFVGSVRQVRGYILRALADGPQTMTSLDYSEDERFRPALQGLLSDGLVEQHGAIICLTAHEHQS
jgi:A/G-specific adenine glycosylase